MKNNVVKLSNNFMNLYGGEPSARFNVLEMHTMNEDDLDIVNVYRVEPINDSAKDIIDEVSVQKLKR